MIVGDPKNASIPIVPERPLRALVFLARLDYFSPDFFFVWTFSRSIYIISAASNHTVKSAQGGISVTSRTSIAISKYNEVAVR